MRFRLFRQFNEVCQMPIPPLLAIAALSTGRMEAQNVSAALTGTVSDSSGSVVPNATVILKSDSTGDTRRTVSNGEG